MLDVRCTERLENQSAWKNTSTESSARPHDVILRRQIVVWLSAVLIVFGLASNCLVFVIFHVFNRKRSFITISNRFVLNLAAANGFMSSAVLPVVIYSALVENGQHPNGSGPFSPAVCRVNALTTLSAISVSIGASVLIAVDRFYAVNRPLHYANHITSTKAWAMIAGSWASSVAVSALPLLLDWDRVRYHGTRLLCLPHWGGQTSLDRTVAVGVVLLYFVLPLLFMVFVYTSVSKAARRTAAHARRNSATSGTSDHVTVDRTHPRRLSDVTASSRNLVRRRSSAGSCAALVFYKEDWKAARTGVVMTSAFVACWMPFFADVFSDAFDVIGCVIGAEIRDYEALFVLLAVSSCVVNPLVYVFRTKAGRDLLLALCYSRHGRYPTAAAAAALLSGVAAAAETKRLSQHGNAVGTHVNV